MAQLAKQLFGIDITRVSGDKIEPWYGTQVWYDNVRVYQIHDEDGYISVSFTQTCFMKKRGGVWIIRLQALKMVLRATLVNLLLLHHRWEINLLSCCTRSANHLP